MPSAEKRTVALALLADAAAILAFAAVGRRSHAEGVTVAGVLATAWPFLSGTAVGWVIVRGWRKPTSLRPTGLVVWLSTLVVGMVLRKLVSATVVPSFVVVAACATAILVLGWRGVVAVLARR